MINKKYLILLGFVLSCTAVNIFAARYYRLLEEERKLYLGLRAIDSVAAYEYLNLPSATERRSFYEQYWQGRDEERAEFEKRTFYAFKEYARYAPLDDERTMIYVKYGEPTQRYVITPTKKIGIVSKEYVRPAEIWTYKNEGIEFDFVRLTRAYQIIHTSYFGDSVKIPLLKDDTLSEEIPSNIQLGKLNFNISFGRFRQRKDLVRLELYSILNLDDTVDCKILRRVQIYNQSDSIIDEKNVFLKPINGDKGVFYDETNLWLAPQKYRVVIEYINLKTGAAGKGEFYVDLLDYKDDAKKISDLVFAKLIDDAEVEEKFFKPVGRVIPLVDVKLPVANSFYIYHEVYSLQTREGQHLLKVDYEIYNKARMRREIVDIMSQTESGEGNIAYIAAKYHPMDLPSGEYIIVARSIDLLGGEEYTAVNEFTLEERK
ncbi:MAG: GWxTD domain-containing protein [bacterium]